MTSASSQLAAFVSETGPVPEAVRDEALRAITNGLATGLAGSHDAATEIAAQLALTFSANSTAGLIGRQHRTDILTASYLNAIAINVHDFDDTHPGTILHPTAPVLPVLLALAETRAVSGAEFLEAFAIGVEVECRIAMAVSPEHYRRGWHITATCGVFGAAAAAGRLLRLDKMQMLHAFGVASAQSSGLIETLGTMAKSIGVGNAARNGLQAALLAERGLLGPRLPLEGPRGFLRVTANHPVVERLTEGLGETWELLRNTYKAYPVGVVLNPVIDAALDLAQNAAVPPDDISSVEIRGHALLAERADRPMPQEGREAQVSAQHAVAVCLRHKRAGLTEFSDREVSDPATIDLRQRVTVRVDLAFVVGAAEVKLTLANGMQHCSRVDQARGDQDRPLSNTELADKLRDLAAWGAPSVDAEALLAELGRLPQATDLGGVLRHMAARL